MSWNEWGRWAGVCGNRTRSLPLEVMIGSSEFGNGEPLFNFKQRNLIQMLGAGETLVNKKDKTPCPPVAYRLVCVSKRSLWLLHGEGVLGSKNEGREMGWGLPWQERGKVIRMRGVTVEMGRSGRMGFET